MTDPIPSTPLLEARAARIDVAGMATAQQLSLRVNGRRVVLAGQGASAIAAALVGRGRVVAGSLCIAGHDVQSGAHFSHVGLAPLDPPLPRRETAAEFVVTSFRFAGVRSEEAHTLAIQVLSDLGLEQLTNRRCETLSIAERRAVVIAQALLPQASAAFIEAPLASLEAPESQYVLAVLGNAARSRRLLTTASRFDPDTPERDLLLGADHISILSDAAVWWSGQPADLIGAHRLLALQVAGDVEAFVSRLAACELAVQGAPPRICVALPEGKRVNDLLQLAMESNVIVLEVLPIIGASPRG